MYHCYRTFVVEVRGVSTAERNNYQLLLPNSAGIWRPTSTLLPLNSHNQNHPRGVALFVVEVRGVEPLSESISARFSPSADKFQHSLAVQTLNRLYGSVESSCVGGATLTRRTDATSTTPSPACGLSGSDGHGLKPRQQQY